MRADELGRSVSAAVRTNEAGAYLVEGVADKLRAGCIVPWWSGSGLRSIRLMNSRAITPDLSVSPIANIRVQVVHNVTQSADNFLPIVRSLWRLKVCIYSRRRTGALVMTLNGLKFCTGSWRS